MSDALRMRIFGTVDDLVADFLYYDRKEDEDLPREAIDDAVREGVVTVDEVVAKFRQCLTDGLTP